MVMDISLSTAFVVNGLVVRSTSLKQQQQRRTLFATEEPFKGDGESDRDGDDDVPESIIKVDDGGSNLTDRFKYKVSA